MNVRKRRILSSDWEMRVSSGLLMISIFGFPDIVKMAYLSRGLFVISFFFYCIKGSRMVGFKYVCWAALFSIWGLLNCIFSCNSITTLAVFLTMLQAVWIGCFEYNWLRKSKRYKEVFLSIIAGGAVLGFRLLNNIDLSRFGTKKIGTIMGINVNSLGFRIAIAFVLALVLVYMSKEKKVLRTIGVALCVFFIALVLVTGSRRALIICFVATVIVLLCNAKNFSKTLKSILFILVAAVGIYILIIKVPQLYNIIGRRLQSFLTSLFQGGNVLDDGRDRMIGTAIDLFWKRPLFGWGMGTFRLTSGINNAYSHNTFAELLYATGLPGLVFYYSIILVALHKIRNKERKSPSKILCITLIMVTLIADFAAVNYSSIVSHVLIALTISLSEGYTWYEKNMRSTGGEIDVY